MPKPARAALWICLTVFVIMNIAAYFHAYKFSHFDSDLHGKAKNPAELTVFEKIRALAFGVSMPRPVNREYPTRPFETVRIKSIKEIEAWLIKTGKPKKGTVILCHGYGSKKSSMLGRAGFFLDAGYDALLIDFMGSGGSEGIQTTIGFMEAEQVKSAYDHIRNTGEEKIVLFGCSMGAVAIMKAQNDYKMDGTVLVLECPFGTMLETVQARFRIMKIPSFPMDRLLVFWGGVRNGFNGFKHNPEDYARGITCPALLLCGQKDDRVSMKEINSIFRNLAGQKTLRTYPLAGHENYMNKYDSRWTEDVSGFLNRNNSVKFDPE
jgi:alpha-beta hydrolase superfamily lysophospholipase